MLKTLRHLLDEVAVARAALPEGENGKLDGVYDTVEGLVVKAEKAADKDAEKVAEQPAEERVAEVSAAVNKVDYQYEAPKKSK